MPSKKVKENEGLVRRSSRTPRQMESTAVLSQSSKKRKIVPSPSSEDRSKKQIKKTIDGRNIDSYCWICHELGQDEICSTCSRVYHSSCLSNKMQFKDEICPECQVKTIDGSDLLFPLSPDKLQRLLSYAVTQVYKGLKVPSCLWRWPSTEENAKLGQVIDGEILIDKLNGDKHHYKSVAAFYSDVKFILHNSHILYGVNSNEVQGAKRLLKRFKTELMDIEACPECYENKISEVRFLPDFFSRICKQPHTIIWAKLKGFPFWPAKSLKVVDDTADVRFFGTHDKAFVPVNNCFLMSREYPTRKAPKQNKFLEAMEELNEYISRYNKEIGTFSFAEGKMAYKPENVDCDLSETIGMGEGDDSLTTTGNDVVDNTLLLTASENDLPEELLDPREEAEFTSLQVSSPLTYPTVTDVNNSASCISKNLDQFVEKEVPSHTFIPVSVCMTFSADEELQRSYESSYRSNASLLNFPASTICTKSASPQNDKNGSQNISVLDPVPSNDLAVVASPVVTGSQSLAMPDLCMEQILMNYINGDAYSNLAHVYGINYNNLSQSQIIQNLQPTRSNWNLVSENNGIHEQDVNSMSRNLPVYDNTLINNIHLLANFSRCATTSSNADQSVPESINEIEFCMPCLSGQCDHNRQVDGRHPDPGGKDIEFICETRGTVLNNSTQQENAPESSSSADPLASSSSADPLASSSSAEPVASSSSADPLASSSSAEPVASSSSAEPVASSSSAEPLASSSSAEPLASSSSAEPLASSSSAVPLASSSSVVSVASDRSLLHMLATFDPKIKCLLYEHTRKMENFLIRAFNILKSLPDGGVALRHLSVENQALRRRICQLGNCLKFMESKFRDYSKQSAERGLNAAKVVKCFNVKSLKSCDEKCDAVYNDYSQKVTETKESTEKEYLEKLELYEKLVKSLEDERDCLKSQNENLLEEVENFKTDIKSLELENKKLFEEVENLKADKKTLELQNEKLMEEVENLKTNERCEINAYVKEQIDIERLKWEQLKNEEVMEAKRADWCNVCLKSASIHCCWNTNYCSNHCRQKHYEKHLPDCLNKESKEETSVETPSVENHQDFTHCSNIQRSVTLMSSSAHHTSVVQAREFMFATNSVTVPQHESTSSCTEDSSPPVLPTPKKTLGASRRKEKNRK